MKCYISPRYTDENMPKPHSFENKAALFHDRWRGWKFEVADKFLNGYKLDGKDIPAVAESGYAALDVIFSYFEPIGKYLEGYCDLNGEKKSGKHFKIGISSILTNIKNHPEKDQVDTLLDMLWGGVRCGIYHAGKPNGHIAITSDIEEALRITTDDKVLILNPCILLQAVTDHIDWYKDTLVKLGESSPLGQNFVKRYDFDNE